MQLSWARVTQQKKYEFDVLIKRLLDQINAFSFGFSKIYAIQK